MRNGIASSYQNELGLDNVAGIANEPNRRVDDSGSLNLSLERRTLVRRGTLSVMGRTATLVFGLGLGWAPVNSIRVGAFAVLRQVLTYSDVHFFCLPPTIRIIGPRLIKSTGILSRKRKFVGAFVDHFR